MSAKEHQAGLLNPPVIRVFGRACDRSDKIFRSGDAEDPLLIRDRFRNQRGATPLSLGLRTYAQ